MEPTESQPNDVVCDRQRLGRTWLPVLLGVLCGLFTLCLLGNHERMACYRITAFILNETPPPKIGDPSTVDATLLMLIPAAVGGCVGVFFSRWRLLAILVVIAGFVAVGGYFAGVPMLRGSVQGS